MKRWFLESKDNGKPRNNLDAGGEGYFLSGKFVVGGGGTCTHQSTTANLTAGATGMSSVGGPRGGTEKVHKQQQQQQQQQHHYGGSESGGGGALLQALDDLASCLRVQDQETTKKHLTISEVKILCRAVPRFEILLPQQRNDEEKSTDDNNNHVLVGDDITSDEPAFGDLRSPPPTTTPSAASATQSIIASVGNIRNNDNPQEPPPKPIVIQEENSDMLQTTQQYLTQSSARLAIAIRALLRSLCCIQNKKMVFFLDDCQWIDRDSHDILEAILGDPQLAPKCSIFDGASTMGRTRRRSQRELVIVIFNLQNQHLSQAFSGNESHM